MSTIFSFKSFKGIVENLIYSKRNLFDLKELTHIWKSALYFSIFKLGLLGWRWLEVAVFSTVPEFLLIHPGLLVLSPLLLLLLPLQVTHPLLKHIYGTASYRGFYIGKQAPPIPGGGRTSNDVIWGEKNTKRRMQRKGKMWKKKEVRKREKSLNVNKCTKGPN
jgi:hypothetical protein